MRVSQYYKLGRTQPYLDFVDVPVNGDIPVFVNPAAIRALPSTWGSDCVSLLQHYFEFLLKRMKAGDKSGAVSLVSSLNERNEFHLGYSKGKSRGHGFGSISGSRVWKSLSESKAMKSSLLTDLEDTCLMIDGIGADMVSDAICNIIRGPLLHYTVEMCKYYGIPMQPGVSSGPIWNPVDERWENKLLELPVTKFGKLVLVPKIIVRFGMWYSVDEYYREYLLPELRAEELRANSSLVETLKDGRKRVTAKRLFEKYGSGKHTLVEQTIKRPNLLQRYKKDKRARTPAPLSHEDFADIEKIDKPNWEELFQNVRSLGVGLDDASKYEGAIEKLLSAIFYPALCSPHKQTKIHQGRKIIDITYVNSSRSGFFAWLAQHYSAAHIFVECKNYGKELGNPELDQLAGRFSPSRGTVGLLVCRKISDKETLLQRCRDTADDSRGFIIPLDDDDIFDLIAESQRMHNREEFSMLRKLFNRLVM